MAENQDKKLLLILECLGMDSQSETIYIYEYEFEQIKAKAVVVKLNNGYLKHVFSETPQGDLDEIVEVIKKNGYKILTKRKPSEEDLKFFNS